MNIKRLINVKSKVIYFLIFTTILEIVLIPMLPYLKLWLLNQSDLSLPQVFLDDINLSTIIIMLILGINLGIITSFTFFSPENIKNINNFVNKDKNLKYFFIIFIPISIIPGMLFMYFMDSFVNFSFNDTLHNGILYSISYIYVTIFVGYSFSFLCAGIYLELLSLLSIPFSIFMRKWESFRSKKEISNNIEYFISQKTRGKEVFIDIEEKIVINFLDFIEIGAIYALFVVITSANILISLYEVSSVTSTNNFYLILGIPSMLLIFAKLFWEGLIARILMFENAFTEKNKKEKYVKKVISKKASKTAKNLLTISTFYSILIIIPKIQIDLTLLTTYSSQLFFSLILLIILIAQLPFVYYNYKYLNDYEDLYNDATKKFDINNGKIKYSYIED